jgi:phage baseplate assembly protein W
MPTSRSFKDISTTFDKNFVTNDLMVAKDFTAIKNSVRNLIMTTPSERFFNPTIGSRLSEQLFEPVDIITVNNIKEEITRTINNFEPRVALNNVIVNITYEEDGYDVLIDYSVVGLPEKTDTIELFLERTRA